MLSSDLRAALQAISPLNVGSPYLNGKLCKVCSGRCRDFDLVDAAKCCSETESFSFGLSGVGVRYLRCDVCGFVFTTDFDDWSIEDFATYIYNSDYAKVDPPYVGERPRELARQFCAGLASLKEISILDFGSGSGIFVDRLRDDGFTDVAGYDPISDPERPSRSFDLITSFEVIEHSPNPVGTMADIASFMAPGGLAYIQTGLQPGNINAIRGRWWYIAPRNGHISIFNLRSLAAAASRAGLVLKVGHNQETILWKPNAEANPQLLTAIAGPAPTNYRHITLLAPEPAGMPEMIGSELLWHPVETDGYGTRYRWSRGTTLKWELEISTLTRLDLELPVAIAVTPEFVRGLKVFVAGRPVPVQWSPPRLSATAILEPSTSPVVIEVETPEPITPHSLGRNDDRRPLGIAVPISEL